MFRHIGETRTLKHNLRIASLLSFVAGVVNIAGFLSVQRLTTNVTGHFAFLVDEVYKLNFWSAFIFFLYIFFFFLGSFFSSLLVEIISRRNERFMYLVPTGIEAVILMLVALLERKYVESNPDLIACSLLFAMGLQNSLVTTISNAVVRTTHLTGLFTDLGIELSQLFFFKAIDQQKRLRSSIRLRLTIIACFFLGGVIGGMLFTRMHLLSLIIPAVLLYIGLVYDYIKFKVILLRKRMSKG